MPGCCGIVSAYDRLRRIRHFFAGFKISFGRSTTTGPDVQFAASQKAFCYPGHLRLLDRSAARRTTGRETPPCRTPERHHSQSMRWRPRRKESPAEWNHIGRSNPGNRIGRPGRKSPAPRQRRQWLAAIRHMHRGLPATHQHYGSIPLHGSMGRII